MPVCTRPAESWLDRLADGGRLILPMTSDQGLVRKSLEGMAKAGAVFRIERRAKDYLAYGFRRLRSFPAPEAVTRSRNARWPKPSPRAAAEGGRGSIAIRRFRRALLATRSGMEPRLQLARSSAGKAASTAL